MANSVLGKVLVLDTVSTTDILQTAWISQYIKVSQIVWDGHAGAGQSVNLTDDAGNTVFAHTATDSNPYSTQFGEAVWIHGIKLPTLDSGKVYVYFM